MVRLAFLMVAFGGSSAAFTLLSGCGRPATDADCQLIVDRSVELQMKEMSQRDERAIAEREQQVRAALGESIKSCESRQVTEKTMHCVRAASSMKELDNCLR